MPTPNYAVKIQRRSNDSRKDQDFEEVLPGSNKPEYNDSIFTFRTKENAIDYAKRVIAENIELELHLHRSLLLKHLDINTEEDANDTPIVACFCTADKPDTICVELTIKLLKVISRKNPSNE